MKKHGTDFQRGNTAVLFALVLPSLLGFAALVLDIGHFWQVRSQLQNGADAAALAGVRDLNGSPVEFPVSRLSTQSYAALHNANQTPLNLSLNTSNSATGDIILGHWDFTARTFTVADAAMPSYTVNAVKVNARRTTAEGGAVTTFLGNLFGKPTQDLTAYATAVGGSPASVCGFPLAVMACSLIDSGGNVECNATLTFTTNSQTAGFTLFDLSNPTTPTIQQAMQNALSGNCVATSTSTGQIKTSNGNNLSQPDVDMINAAVAAAGSNGLYVNIAVLDTGSLTGGCGSLQYNGDWNIAGYVSIKIIGATGQPNRSILATVDCTHTNGGIVGGNGFYGLPSSAVYIVQ